MSTKRIRKWCKITHHKFGFVIHISKERIYVCLTTSKDYDYLHVSSPGCTVESKQQRNKRRKARKEGSPIKRDRDCYLLASSTTEFNQNSFLQFDNIHYINLNEFSKHLASSDMIRRNFLTDHETLAVLQCMNKSKQVVQFYKKKLREKTKSISDKIYPKK